MDSKKSNKFRNAIKTIISIIVLLIIILLFIKGCNKKIINDGIKIIDIKQSVDSFNADTIFLDTNLRKGQKYSYDITIHNYLNEDYYLYKIEINNDFISYDELIKLLKSKKNTKFRLNITPEENINDEVEIKLYYGKLKEIRIEDDIVTFFGNEKVQLPEGKAKEGYKFLGYTDKEGSTKVKYKSNEKYDLDDKTTLYPIYEKDKTPSDNPNTGPKQTDNNQEKEGKKYIVTFDYQNGNEKTTKEVTYNEKYGTLPTATKNGYAFIGWYLNDTKITSDSIVTITKDETLKARYIIINYSINYDLNGGTVSSNPDSYTIESEDITLLNPTKSGAEFIGWTGSNGSTPDKNVVIKKGSTGSKNYIANFSANEIVNYKVIHKKETLDGSYETEEEVFSAPYDSIVKPEVKTYEGFTSPSVKEIKVKQDGTSKVEYEYTRKKYTFTLGDNENVISSVPSGEYPYETEITLTAKEKTGYTFKNWSDNKTDNPITFLLTRETSINPVYEANKYLVVFSSNTGIGSMDDQEYTYDQEQALSLNKFTKVGHRFVGWNTKANGEGTPYLDGASVKNLATEGSITLYAQFIAEQYTISFDTDGGDELFDTTRTYGETYGILPEATKLGYTFAGWYIGDNKIESSTVVDITSNVTLKAKYTIINYDISYDLNDGTVATANPLTYTVEDEFTLNNPTKQGYEFAGWTGTGLDGLTTSVKINKGTTENLSFTANYTAGTSTPYKVIHKYQDYNLTTYTDEEQSLTGVTGTTVYPQIRHKDGFIDPEVTSVLIKADGTARLEYTYQRDSYTYSYNEDVTSSKEAGTYLFETEITISPKEKDGYTFKEWSNSKTENPLTFLLSENTNISPIYEANKYNVIFNANTGIGSMSAQEMTYDTEAELSKNTFTKTGYTFAGWNTKDDGEGTPYSDEASVKNLAKSGNIILYAQWTANTNTAYKVIHKYQNLDLITYTEDVENKTGTTDTEVTPSIKSKTGFVDPSTKTVTISGDGLTEVIYTYNRETYTYTLTDTDNVTSTLPSGTYPYGTEITLTANEIPGYTFDEWNDNNTDNPRTITLNDDVTLNPIYTANTDTPYTVKHYKQNITLDGYDLADTDNLTGTTDAEVTPSVKNYEGFTTPSLQTVTISGDGQTEVIYNYTREMYTYTLEEAENVISTLPSGSYPYGTEITLTAKEIPGYTFDKWNDNNTDNPRTITLTGNTSLKATYTANTNTAYTVKHYKQNITLDGYTLAETDNLTGTTDTKVTPNVKEYEGFTAPVPTEVTIKGDGTTVVEYNYTRNEYTFTLNDAEDVISTLPSGSYPYETSITLTAKPKEGYNFYGWSDGNNDNPRTIVLNTNIELSPVYTNRTDTTYTVIYETMNLDGTTYSEYRREVLTGETGSKVTPEVITITGFTKPAAQEITIKADGTTSLEYKYTRNKYNLSYSNVEDIDLSNSTPEGNYYYKTEITVTAKTKDGYTFKNWSNGDSANPTTFILDDDNTITAYYDANKYNVVFNSNTGTGSMSDQEMTYDTKANLTKNTFTKEGYTFAGWNTDPYGEGTPYSDEAEVMNLAKSGNIVLYAQWTANTNTPYTVIHKYQNIDLTTYTEETDNLAGTTGAEVTPSIKSKTGFVNPNTQTVTISGDGLTEVIYIYNREMYTYTLTDTENVISSLPSGSYPYETEITLTAKEIPGYKFESWSNGETSNPLVITLDDDLEIRPIYFANTDTPYTVKHYKQNITLDGYDLAETDNLTGETDTEVTPSVKNYEGFTAPNTQTVTINGDGTTEVIYNYTRNEYIFTLNDAEKVISTLPSGSYPYGTEITLTAKEIPGYTFDKWSDNSTTNPRTITLNDDITISPVYTANTNTPYEVKHYKQNITLDGYDLEDTDKLTGTTDAEVTPSVKNYEGFTAPNTQTVTISGDGTTEVIYNYTRKMYTYTLIDTDNITSTLPSGSYPYETTITVTANEIPGYTFDKWENNSTTNPRTITLSENMNVSATYTANTNTPYKVIHRYQNIDLTTYTEEIENKIGETDTQVTPAVISRTGFNNPELQTITISGDGQAEVIYNYTRKMYTYTLEDTENVTSTLPSGTYPYGTEITVTATPPTGQTFVKWSDDNTDNPRVIVLTTSISISPVFDSGSSSYSVIFDSNGGTGSMSGVTYDRDVTYTLPSNTFARTGYTFAGWNTEADGSGDEYYDGEEVINITNSNSVTLYALWAESQYVAQIGNEYYTTLQLAINAVPTTKEETKVKLLKNTAEVITIANTQNVLLNLQNHTLSNSTNNTNVIINNGILKIYNGTITSSAGSGAINNNSGATLIMSGGRLIVTGTRQGFYNDGGTLTITGTAYVRSDATQRATVHNRSNGTVNITGGTIVSTALYALYNEGGTINIGTKDGEIHSETPVIQGRTYGIAAYTKYNFYDGIIKGVTNHAGKTSGTGNTPTVSVDTNETKINNLEEDSVKVYGTEVIDGLTYQTLTLSKNDSVYTIRFDANGGTTSVEKMYVTKEESIGELPTASRDGDTFIGWVEDLITGIVIEESYVPTSDMYLYAKYYKSIENATISPEEITMDIGEEETISVTNIEEEYTFRSTDSEVATVDANGKVTGVSVGTTTIEITGTTSGKTVTVPVTVLTNVYYKVTFDPGDGTVLEPTRFVREGYEIGDLPTATYGDYDFLGWYTAGGSKIKNNEVITSDVIYYAKYGIDKTVNYYANEGIFDNNEELNTINYTYSYGTVTKYSSTPNVDNTGVADGTYANNLSINDIVTIEGATSLNIEVWYSTEGESWDWLAIYPEGVTPTEDNYSSATISNGKLGGGKKTYKPSDSDTTYHKTFTVNGDTAQFYFRSDGSQEYYGYYAIITASAPTYVGDVEYKESTKEGKIFAGWNTKIDGTGKPFLDESEIKNNIISFEDNTDLYAQYILPYATFKPGKVVNAKMKQLSGQSGAEYYTWNKTITAVIRSETKPDDSILIDDNIVSTPDSISPIYMWYANNTIYYYSEADTIRLNPDSSYMFYALEAVETIDTSSWDTNKVTNMDNMFYYCEALTTLDVSKWDTSKVTNMDNMFYYCKALTTLDVSKWDTKNVTNMNSMFHYCEALTTLDVSKWDTSKVTNMGSMFEHCEKITTLDVSKWDIGKVTNIGDMFWSCFNLETLDVSKWNTSNVIDMSDIFYNCEKLATLDVSKWDTKNVTNMDSVFNGCNSLTTLDVSKWDTSKVTNMRAMFSGCRLLTTLDLSSWNTSNVTNMASMFYGCNNLTTIYASDKFVTTKVDDSSSMFYNDTNLVGGNGTTYNSSKTDKEYARLDLGYIQPGYFTNKDNYYVVFDANGGTVIDNYKVVTPETAVGELPTPIREGYTFIGWYTGLDDGIEITSDYVPTSNINVIARYYKDISGSTVSPTSVKLAIGETETITVTDVEEEYTFTSSNSDIVTVDNNGLITGISKGNATITVRGVSSNKTVSVSVRVFENYYTISFETNGGTPVEDIRVEQGEAIEELPETERKGHTLDGWYLEESLDNRVDTSYVPIADTRLYAKWDENPFDTVFSQTGACTFNGSSSNITGEDCGDYTNLKYINTNVRLFNDENVDKDFEIGFTIVSRGTNSNNASMMNSKDESGSPYPGIVYRIKDSLTEELSAAANNSVSLKPTFSSETTTKVVIKRIDGILYISINDGEDTQVIDMTDMIYTFNTPVTFGASLTGSGSPQRYFIGTLSNMYIKLGTYKDSNKHTIRLDANGGTVSPKKKSVVKGEQIGELPTPTKDGYAFMGWVENLLSGPIIEETYTPSSDMYLYAKYYKSIDGATVSPTEITMDVGDNETISVTGAEEEYTFSSKNSSVATVDANGKVTGVSAGTTTIEITGSTSGKKVTVPVTVLTNVYYTVTFNPNEGTVDETTRRIRDGYKVGELPTPTYGNYKFVGWYTASSGGSKVTKDTVVTKNVTYYARFTSNKTINYYSNDGKFDNNETLYSINYTHASEVVTTYSSTPNINADGTANGTYDNDLVMNDVVTIEGATSLNIEVWYSTESTSCDWLAIYPAGVEPTDYNYSSATISNGKLAGGKSTTKPADSDTTYHKIFTVYGDTAQFYFKSDSSSTYYGYYAIITSDEYVGDKVYKEPTIDTENYVFHKWTTNPDGTGESFKNEAEVKNNMVNFENNTDLYAQYVIPYTMFKTGNEVNTRMNQLSGHSDMYEPNTSITAILRATDKPDDSVLIDDNIVSTADSIRPIYMWYESGIIYYYSDVNTIYLNPDSSHMFYYFGAVTTIDTSSWDTSKVTNMASMFEWTENLTTLDVSKFDTKNVTNMSGLFGWNENLTTLDVSKFDTKSVTTMRGMFEGCKNLTALDVSKFDTSKVTDMAYMFYACQSLTTIDVSKWITSNVTDMSGVFWCCNSLTTIDVSKWDTKNVTNMNSMFLQAESLTTLDLSSFDTSKVTNMALMFDECENLITLDLSSFDTSKVTDMQSMFYRCYKLTTIYASDKFVTNNVTESNYMFTDDTRLVGGNGTTYNSSKTDKEYAHIDGVGGPGYFTAKSAKSGTLNSSPKKGITASPKTSSEPVIKTITFDANGGTGSMDAQEFDINSDSAINTNSFTNTNTQEFIGWNTASDGLGIGYADGDTIMANTFSDNITLYAQWQQHGWTLVNRDSIDISNLDEQELAYYDHGVRIESGFHVLPNLNDDDKLYYFSNGVAQSGWIKDTDDNWFYFSKLDNNDDGYVDLDAYVNGDYVIDGVTYRFDENGICLNHDGSSLAASVAGFTNNKFEIPIEAYSLRRYFMGIVY